MDYRKLIENMNTETYQGLRRAIELGKWPDGQLLSDEQKALCMEAILNWELLHVPPEQRTGYIDRGHKAEGETCADEQILQLDEKPPRPH